MSDTLLTAETARPAFSARFSHTPMRDLIRGRVTGRLDLDAKLKQSGLPAETAALIRQTVRRTRLWSLEQVAVADELIAHFRDALDQGAAPEAAAQDFGNPAAVAKLIRRAKKRQRSLGWKLFRVARWGVAAIALFCALFVGRFFWSFPTPKVDYLAAVNAPASALAEDDRAWPHYRDAWLQAGFTRQFNLDALENPAVDAVAGVRWPGDPEWEETETLLQDFGPMLEKIRSAAGLPGLGLELTYNLESSAKDSTLFFGSPTGFRQQQNTTHSTEEHLRNTSLEVVFMPHLSQLQRQSNLLVADLGQAAHRGDFSRLTANVDALLGLARHSAEARHPWPMYRGLRIYRDTLAGIQAALARYPQSFAPEQLQILSKRLHRSSPETWVDYAAAQIVVLDQLQRVFADGGRGIPTATGLGLLNTDCLALKSDWPQYPSGNWLFAMSNTARTTYIAHQLPRGEEVHQLLQYTVNGFMQEASRPMHETPITEIESEFRQAQNDSIEYEIVSPFLDHAVNLRRHLAWTTAQRNGTQIALALETHRLHHGRYPATLQELVPHHLAVVPADPITGGVLHYRLDRGRPLVYSTGCDHDDDHGARAISYRGEPLTRIQAASNVAYWNPEYAHDPQRDGDWILYDARPREPASAGVVPAAD